MLHLIFTSFLATLVASDTILQYGSGDLPSCAQNCQTLNTAQYLCIPPVAPTSSQTIYDTCFCQSNYFVNTLAVGTTSDPSNVCNSVCTSGSEQLAIQKWYDNLCKGTTASTTTTGSGTSSTGSSSGSGNGGSDNYTGGQLWWHQHARWIIMAIVLLIGFIVIAVVGIWIRRRVAKKHAEKAARAPPVVWGPHQNQHATGGVAYSPQPDMRQKGKGPMAAVAGPSTLPTASQAPVDYSQRDGKKRLSKLFGR